MKYLTNKTLLGGVAVVAVLAGLYLGYTHMGSDIKADTVSTTTSQTQEVPAIVPTTLVPTTPAVNTEETPTAVPVPVPVPTIKSDTIKNVDESVTKTQ